MCSVVRVVYACMRWAKGVVSIGLKPVQLASTYKVDASHVLRCSADRADRVRAHVSAGRAGAKSCSLCGVASAKAVTGRLTSQHLQE